MTNLPRRRALLIGNERYNDDRFGPLPSTHADVWGLEQVLRNRNIGSFATIDSRTDLNADDMREAISDFLLEKCDEDELAFVYVSGHGTRLVRAGGEFYFAATDTDFDRVAETGVSSGFVNEQLEQCVAQQKVVMIDCCRSGGFAVGLRTSDAKGSASTAQPEEDKLLTSRGVYVLSSSRAGEDSYADRSTTDEIQPSAFTGEVIEALRTGKVGKNSTGRVTANDLFEYVNRHMKAQGARQVPTVSSYGVDGRIILADCPLGRPPLLVPLTRKPPDATGQTARPTASKSPRQQPTWDALLEYYRRCVQSEDTKTPLMSVGGRDASYVCLSGAEQFLSGEVDEDGCVPVPDEAGELIKSAVEEEAELWAGYPAVVLNGPRAGTPWRHPKFAPLLMRRIEVVQQDGTVRLKPYGPVQPHPQLAKEWLGEEDAAELTDTFQPTWHRGQHDRMAVEVRNLLAEDFELPCVQEPRPDSLDPHIDIRTPGHGARNTAVLFSALPETNFTRKLLKDFDDIAGLQKAIESTALAVLSPDASQRERALAHVEQAPLHLVAPLLSNEGQAAVINSAMTHRLTVATGPPGTGKSQLVANLVATAVANGQSVLVASTNNEAVDEVWQRCEKLVPGSVVRTGSRTKTKDYTQTEADALHVLRTATQTVGTLTTAAMDTDIASDGLAQVHKALAQASTTERQLLEAGGARGLHADRLGRPAAEVVHILSGASNLEPLAHKAGRLAHARVLGNWRRNRFLNRHRLRTQDRDAANSCLALADFIRAEIIWRQGHDFAASIRDDQLAAQLNTAEQAVRTASLTHFNAAVQGAAARGRQRIIGLLTASDGDRSDWPALREVLGRARGRREQAAVPAWAVTSLSARRFPIEPALFDLVVIDEASQCAIPHVLPLLFRARRALVIGDAQQLTHIAEVGPEREALIRRDAGLHADWLEKYRLAYRRHSAFHAAAQATNGTLLLDEHFRCHPDIAELSNKHFYDGELTVLTDIRNRPAVSRPPITWSNTSGHATRPPHGSSWVNGPEADRARDCVRYLLDHLPPEATVGVVTPFKGQAEELRSRLASFDRDRLRIGTVHTFQGGERDAMVFSLVAAEGISSGAVSWVERQLNLWNVAITRARSHLIVVGDATYWRARKGIATDLLTAAEETAQTDGDATPTDQLKRLYQELSKGPGSTVTLGQRVNGHPVEAITRDPHGNSTAFLLDTGPEDGDGAARHLRLMLHRTQLVSNDQNGHTAERYPAWKLYDTSRG
ncbi:AAA domain-containing protein [Streptomyces scopuliridis]|uniref:caspase, EACC1-associated type n=1 Tax=Streptomyces scopuliridis TaxID=452529 RepID=UPI0036883148